MPAPRPVVDFLGETFAYKAALQAGELPVTDFNNRLSGTGHASLRLGVTHLLVDRSLVVSEGGEPVALKQPLVIYNLSILSLYLRLRYATTRASRMSLETGSVPNGNFSQIRPSRLLLQGGQLELEQVGEIGSPVPTITTPVFNQLLSQPMPLPDEGLELVRQPDDQSYRGFMSLGSLSVLS